MFQHRKFSSTSTRPVSHTCKLGCGWRRQGPQALPPGNLEGTGPARVGQLSLPPCLSPLGKKAQQQVHGATCMGSCLLSHPLPPLSKPSAWPLLRKLECLLCRKSQDRGRDVQVSGSLCHPLGGRVGRDGPSGGTYRPGLASLPWALAGGCLCWDS